MLAKIFNLQNCLQKEFDEKFTIFSFLVDCHSFIFVVPGFHVKISAGSDKYCTSIADLEMKFEWRHWRVT